MEARDRLATGLKDQEHFGSYYCQVLRIRYLKSQRAVGKDVGPRFLSPPGGPGIRDSGWGWGGKMTQCSHFPCLLPLGTLSPDIKPNIPQQELGMQTSSVGMQFDYFNSRLPFSNCILFLFKKHIPIICFICQGRFSKLTAEPSLLC